MMSPSQELLSMRPVDRLCGREGSKGQSKGQGGVGKAGDAGDGAGDDFEGNCQRIGEFMVHLWQDQRMCDVVIRCSDGVVKAHKAVLSAYSPFCYENFSKFPNESAVNIDLCEFPLGSIRMLLDFLYLRKQYEMNASNVANMLKAGGELGLMEVVESGIDFLCDVNAQNALYHYAIADHCCLEKTREKIFFFILDNFREVSKTRHFMWLHPEVLLRLLSDDQLKVVDELEVFYSLVSWIDCDRCKRLPLAPTLLMCGLRLMEIAPEDLISKVGGLELIKVV